MGNLASKWQNQSSPLLPAESPGKATELDTLARELLANVAATGVAIVHEEFGVPDALVCAVSVGTCVPPLGAHLHRHSGISGRCIREGRTQRSHDTCIDPRVEQVVIERLGIRSLVAAPIFVGSRCVGLIEAVSDQPGHFDEGTVALLESAADAAAELLGNQQKPSEKPIPPQSQVTSSSEPVQKSNSAAVSGTHEASSESELIDHSSFAADPIKLLDFGEKPMRLGKLASWCLVAAVVLIAIVVTFYVLYPHTSRQSMISANRAHSSPSNLPTASAATPQNQKQMPALPSTAGKNRTESNAVSEAASRGVMSDQLKLAEGYLEGNGGQREPEKAASWYIIAGENGSVKAKRRSIQITRGMAPFQIGQIRFDVAKMFMNGIGTTKDDVAAYTWFELAKAEGDVRAEGEEEILKRRMQPAQVKQANRRASAWLQSHARKLRGRGKQKRAINVNNGEAQ